MQCVGGCGGVLQGVVWVVSVTVVMGHPSTWLTNDKQRLLSEGIMYLICIILSCKQCYIDMYMNKIC